LTVSAHKAVSAAIMGISVSSLLSGADQRAENEPFAQFMQTVSPLAEAAFLSRDIRRSSHITSSVSTTPTLAPA
jgi:hypothetical protein